VASEVFSATSYSELARGAREAERHARLHPLAPPTRCHLRELLPGTAPVVASSDWVRAWPGLIAPHLDARMHILGTDGFGRSDTRAALRDFFEIDRHHVVVAALGALGRQAQAAQAIAHYGLDTDTPASWRR
jgi:pyruvate dehydrogenase E1 component